MSKLVCCAVQGMVMPNPMMGSLGMSPYQGAYTAQGYGGVATAVPTAPQPVGMPPLGGMASGSSSSMQSMGSGPSFPGNAFTSNGSLL